MNTIHKLYMKKHDIIEKHFDDIPLAWNMLNSIQDILDEHNVTLPELYYCDRCKRLNTLQQAEIKEMQHYIEPHGCFAGDYYVHDHYYFECRCGRPIEVNKKDVRFFEGMQKTSKDHGAGRCIKNIEK